MRNPTDVKIAPAVTEAITARRPVVALETTLVTHGFPHPEGLEIAAELEAAVAAEGAQPATIGIVDGRICVGLGHAELERLATCGRAVKLNLSNLAATLYLDPGDRRPWRQPCSWRGALASACSPPAELAVFIGTRSKPETYRPT